MKMKAKLGMLLSSCLVFALTACPIYVIAATASNSGITPIAEENGAKSITTDSDVQNLRMVDGIERFKRNYFLKKAFIDIKGWIDDRRILARAFDAPANRAHPDLESRAFVVIDTETGAIERLPWNTNTEAKCLNNGRIVLWERLSSELQAWYLGEFGKQLVKYTAQSPRGAVSALPKEWKEQGFELDINNCRLSKSFWAHPAAREFIETKTTRAAFAKALDTGQGWLVETYPWRSDSPVQITYLLIKEDGSRLAISTTTGERRFTELSPIAFADGYFTYPELHFGNPQHVWSPHFARLIHPDGRVERFPVPSPLMDQIIEHHEVVRAQYTKRGPLWVLDVHDSKKDSDRLSGAYLPVGRELVRVAQRVIWATSPSGCKLAGESERTWQQQNDLKRINDPRDYFVINLCTE